MRIGVNLFSAQMNAGGLTQTIATRLQENELPPELLEIEITEKTILREDPAALVTLTEIRELGVGMAFDDYGTGYASLSMLTEYPITRLKIDRTFCPSNGDQRRRRSHRQGNRQPGSRFWAQTRRRGN